MIVLRWECWNPQSNAHHQLSTISVALRSASSMIQGFKDSSPKRSRPQIVMMATIRVDENNCSLFRKFMSNIQRCFTGEGARGLDFISPRWIFLWHANLKPFSGDNLYRKSIFSHKRENIFIPPLELTGCGYVFYPRPIEPPLFPRVIGLQIFSICGAGKYLKRCI